MLSSPYQYRPSERFKAPDEATMLSETIFKSDKEINQELLDKKAKSFHYFVWYDDLEAWKIVALFLTFVLSVSLNGIAMRTLLKRRDFHYILCPSFSAKILTDILVLTTYFIVIFYPPTFGLYYWFHYIVAIVQYFGKGLRYSLFLERGYHIWMIFKPMTTLEDYSLSRRPKRHYALYLVFLLPAVILAQIGPWHDFGWPNPTWTKPAIAPLSDMHVPPAEASVALIGPAWLASQGINEISLQEIEGGMREYKVGDGDYDGTLFQRIVKLQRFVSHTLEGVLGMINLTLMFVYFALLVIINCANKAEKGELREPFEDDMLGDVDNSIDCWDTQQNVRIYLLDNEKLMIKLCLYDLMMYLFWFDQLFYSESVDLNLGYYMGDWLKNYTFMNFVYLFSLCSTALVFAFCYREKLKIEPGIHFG